MKDSRIKKVLITQKEVEQRISELAKWVNNTYKNSKQLILVGILKGSIPFIAQLMKEIEVDHVIDFMTISTYDGAIVSSGEFKLVMDLKHNIRDMDVLIVEDIIDSGTTLSKVAKTLKDRSPRSLKTLTLLDKPKGRVTHFEPDKVGFVVPNEFLVGFGLDVKGKLRNLPYIGVFDAEKLDKI